ncbi:MAG: urease accessory protein UreD [Fibrobacter sp.]|nr:urease accessory protein UreD [Fibrobacter sp.]
MTEIEDAFYTSPYKVMHPFHNGKHSDIMMMAASAGLLGGDHFSLQLEFGESSDATFLSQSYEKVFNTDGKIASKDIDINVGADARVNYMPYPAIPFAGSNYQSNAVIKIDPSATFLYADIFTCGRTGMGEFFAMEKFQSKSRFYVGEHLAFADHTLIDPKKFDYTKIGFWGSYTHNGMFFAYSPEKETIVQLKEKVREMGKKIDCVVGTSFAEKGLIVRALAMRGETIWDFFQNIQG